MECFSGGNFNCFLPINNVQGLQIEPLLQDCSLNRHLYLWVKFMNEKITLEINLQQLPRQNLINSTDRLSSLNNLYLHHNVYQTDRFDVKSRVLSISVFIENRWIFLNQHIKNSIWILRMRVKDIFRSVELRAIIIGES